MASLLKCEEMLKDTMASPVCCIFNINLTFFGMPAPEKWCMLSIAKQECLLSWGLISGYRCRAHNFCVPIPKPLDPISIIESH